MRAGPSPGLPGFSGGPPCTGLPVATDPERTPSPGHTSVYRTRAPDRSPIGANGSDGLPARGPLADYHPDTKGQDKPGRPASSGPASDGAE